MRLNAKYRDFWARGQKWYHFWADTTSEEVSGEDIIEEGVLEFELHFEGRGRATHEAAGHEPWVSPIPWEEEGLLTIELDFSAECFIEDTVALEEEELLLTLLAM